MLDTCLACSSCACLSSGLAHPSCSHAFCSICMKRWINGRQHDVCWWHVVVESRPQQAPPQLRVHAAQPGVALCHPAVRGAERRPLVAPTVWRGCQKNPW